MTLGTALAAVRLLSTFLYGISSHDAVTFRRRADRDCRIAAIACLIPARRAVKVDPLVALRMG